jgi:hypothetical protein
MNVESGMKNEKRFTTKTLSLPDAGREHEGKLMLCHTCMF